MARIEWVKQRLQNWALWKARRDSSGLGYARTSVLGSLGGYTSGYREATIPVDEVEAARTNMAVESLRITRSHLYVTLNCIYVRGIGVKATARLMSRAESTIKAQLGEADAAIAQWFTDNKPRLAPTGLQSGGFTP